MFSIQKSSMEKISANVFCENETVELNEQVEVWN